MSCPARGSTALAARADGTKPCTDDGCESCPNTRHQPDPAKVYDVPVGDSPVRGSDAAKVTIVVACDFECRYCRRVQPTLERVRETYGSSVRLVFKHNPLPFHQEAVNAALAAEAAREQGKFWEMHDLLLANQQQLGEGKYLAWAEQLGLDVGRFRADLHSSALREWIEADQRQVRSLGGKGPRNNNLRGIAPRFGSDSVEPIERNRRNTRSISRPLAACGEHE